jgi:YVTN family beta-propeller protein
MYEWTTAATHPIAITGNPIGDIAADPAGGTLVVTHPRDGAVSILDANDPAAASVITLDGDPVAVAVAAGRAFIATTSASYDAAYVLDLDTKSVVSAHPLEFTITSLAVSPDGARLFAARTGRLGNDVAVVDLATSAVTSIPIAARDASIVDAIRAGTNGLLYAGVCSFRGGELVVVDGAQQRVVATVEVGAPVWDITLSPAGAVAHVLAHNPRGAAAVLCIDLARRTISAAVEVGESATHVAVSPDGAEVYVVDRDGVAVICAVTGEVVDRITVGARPSCVAVSPADGHLYVADYAGVLTGLPVRTPVPHAVTADVFLSFNLRPDEQGKPALRIHKAPCRTVITHRVSNTNKECTYETRTHDHGRGGGDPRRGSGGLFPPRRGSQRRQCRCGSGRRVEYQGASRR